MGENTFDRETILGAGHDPQAPGLLWIGHDKALGTQPLRIQGGYIGYVSDNQTLENPVTIEGDFGTASAVTTSGGRYIAFGGPVTLTKSVSIETRVGRHLGIDTAFGGGNPYAIRKWGDGYLRLLGGNTHGGGTTVEAGGLILGGDSTGVAPIVSGPAGTGSISLWDDSFIAPYTGVSRISNPVYLDGNAQLGATAYTGSLHLDGPVYLTGNRVIRVHQASTSSPFYVNAGITDSGRRYRMDTYANSNGPYAAFGGVNNIGGGVAFWKWTSAIQPDSVWNTPAFELLDSTVILLTPSVDGSEINLPKVVFDSASPKVNVTAAAGEAYASSLVRKGRGMLNLLGGGSGSVLRDAPADRLFVRNGAPAVVNGMVAPYLLNNTYFVTYDETFGFDSAAFDFTNDINAQDPNAIHSVTSQQTLTDDNVIHALRTSSSIDGSGHTLTVNSGGVIFAGGTPTISSAVDFGEAEAIIHNAVAATLAGKLTGKNGFTKSGTFTLVLGAGNDLEGPITLHEGTLQLDAAGALPSGEALAINSGATLALNGQDLVVDSLYLGGGIIGNASDTPSTLTVGRSVVHEHLWRNSRLQPSSGKVLNLALTEPTVFDVADGIEAQDLEIGSTSLAVTISGANSPITKRGAGALYIAGENTFKGDLTLEDGMLTARTISQQVFGDSSNSLKLRRNAVLVQTGTANIANTLADLSFAGGNRMHYGISSTMFLYLDTITRIGRGTLTISGTSGDSHWGGNGRFIVDAWDQNSPNVNGMLPPYLLATGFDSNNQDWGNFTLWDTSVTPNRLRYVRTFNSTSMAGAASTHLINLTTAQTLSGSLGIWALRTTADVDDIADSTLTLGSGGLLLNAAVNIAPALRFGVSGDTEGVIFVSEKANEANPATIASTLTTTAGITKVGAGTLVLAGDSSATLGGEHWLNEGRLRLARADALQAGASVNLERGTTLELAGGYTLDYDFAGLGAITSSGNTLTASGTFTPGFANEIGTLSVDNLDFRGQINWEFAAPDSCDVIACDNLSFGEGAAKTITALWTGDGEPVPGSYPVFTYHGTAPAFNLAEWTVNRPRGMTAELRHDNASKMVVLDITEAPSSLLIILR